MLFVIANMSKLMPLAKEWLHTYIHLFIFAIGGQLLNLKFLGNQRAASVLQFLCPPELRYLECECSEEIQLLFHLARTAADCLLAKLKK